jgi:hypothetical protein
MTFCNDLELHDESANRKCTDKDDQCRRLPEMQRWQDRCDRAREKLSLELIGMFVIKQPYLLARAFSSWLLVKGRGGYWLPDQI